MQSDFQVKQGINASLPVTHVGEVVAFVYGQRPGTGKLDQKQVVLFKVMPETFSRQGSRPQLTHKLMLGIGLPVLGTRLL